ncbi:MAG TPA: hypothetical protein VI072_17920 [Polyangiaceae bacterium]
MALSRHFSSSTLIIVTRETGRFERAVAAAGTPILERLFVLPRPIWGWALLDRVLKRPPSSDPGAATDGTEEK